MGLSSAVALMVFMLLYMPCIATLAAIRNAFGTRWMLFSMVYQATLRVFEARGYVTRDGCAAATSGCGWCSFQATCAGDVRERWARRAG